MLRYWTCSKTNAFGSICKLWRRRRVNTISCVSKCSSIMRMATSSIIYLLWSQLCSYHLTTALLNNLTNTCCLWSSYCILKKITLFTVALKSWRLLRCYPCCPWKSRMSNLLVHLKLSIRCYLLLAPFHRLPHIVLVSGTHEVEPH